MSNVENADVKKVLSRFGIYTLIVFAITLSLPFIVEYIGATLISETGPVEWTQILLVLSSAVLLFKYSFSSNFRQLFTALALIQTIVIIRELDFVFDDLPVIEWQIPAFIVLFVLGVFCFKNKTRLLAQTKDFIGTRGFALLWCGFIIVVPFSQLVGHGHFLKALMGDDFVRDYKRVIEELGELLGYLILLFGSIEAVLLAKEGKSLSNSKPGQASKTE